MAVFTELQGGYSGDVPTGVFKTQTVPGMPQAIRDAAHPLDTGHLLTKDASTRYIRLIRNTPITDTVSLPDLHLPPEIKHPPPPEKHTIFRRIIAKGKTFLTETRSSSRDWRTLKKSVRAAEIDEYYRTGLAEGDQAHQVAVWALRQRRLTLTDSNFTGNPCLHQIPTVLLNNRK